jgi:cell shape-determining protein MreC
LLCARLEQDAEGLNQTLSSLKTCEQMIDLELSIINKVILQKKQEGDSLKAQATKLRSELNEQVF